MKAPLNIASGSQSVPQKKVLIWQEGACQVTIVGDPLNDLS